MVNMEKLRGIFNNSMDIECRNDGHLCHTILELFGVRYLVSSAISDGLSKETSGKWRVKCNEQILSEFFRDKKIDHLVEIGTYLGVTALLFARYVEKVTTFDAYPRTDAIALWDTFGAEIDYFASGIQEEIDKSINDLEFDFAYIDADHSYEHVKHDFSIVKKCGRVLFHDYYTKEAGVKKFIDELPTEELTFLKPFVYWEAK